MEDADNPRNKNILSQSYMEGVKRITGNRNTFEQEYRTCDKVLEKRQQSWAWLFEKFSEISDDIELNIQTLRPHTESSGSLDHEERVLVRKTAAQIQFWIDTGNPPCQAAEAYARSDTEESHSIIETEGDDFELTQSSTRASMIVNNELTNGGVKGITTESSVSSVDTATYIKNNASTSKIKEKDNRAKNFGNMDNNIVARSINAAIPRVLLHRITEYPKKLVRRESMEIDKKCSSEIVASTKIALNNNKDKCDEILATTSQYTIESKESGIDSSAVECTEKREETVDRKSSSDSEEIFPSLSQSSSRGKRKLFTEDKNIFDFSSPGVTKAVQHFRWSGEKNFHPALDSPSSIPRKKVRVRPRLLTLSRGCARIRRSKNFSFNTKNRNRSLLSKSRVLEDPQKSDRNETKTAINVETSNILGNKCSNHSVNVNYADGEKRHIQIASKVDKTMPTTLNSVIETRKKAPMNKSANDHSSSLSSQDVSQIINEELNRNSRNSSEIVQKKNQSRDSNCTNIGKSDREVLDSDQGSIFKTCASLSSETRESRIANMQNIRKNLCTSDLKSSEDTKSPLNSSPDDENNFVSDNSFGNASTILLSDSGRGVRSSKRSKKSLTKNPAQFIPVVVLHDFLILKNCCRDSEREINKFWSRKQKEKENLRKDEEGVVERIPTIKSSEKDRDILKSKKELEGKILESKKPRLENGLSVLEHNPENLFSPNRSLDSEESELPKKRAANSKNEEVKDDSNHFSDTSSNFSDPMKSGMKLVDEAKSKITFTKTNSNHRSLTSMFFLTSSDDDDFLEILKMTTKSMHLRKKPGVNNRETENSVSGTKNKALNGSESVKTHQESYKIVSSSSDEEEKTVKLVSGVSGSRKVRRKYSKRNKRKDSEESRLTMCLEEDICAEDRSEDFIKNLNDELEKQSLRVNRCSEGIKKSKQSLETGKDYLVTRKNKDDTENLTDRNLSAERIFGNEDEVEPKNFSRMKIIDREDYPDRVDARSRPSVDRLPNSPQKLGSHISKHDSKTRNSTRESNPEGDKRDRKSREKMKKSAKSTPRKNLTTSGETSESKEELEPKVCRIPNHKDGSKINSPEKAKRNNDESRISDKSKTCAKPKLVQIVLSDDELSRSGDVRSFLNSKNYAGDNSRHTNNRDKEYEGESDSDIFSSKINYVDRSNRGIHVDKRASKSSTSKRRIRNRDRRATPNIIYRTKDCWESESDS